MSCCDQPGLLPIDDALAHMAQAVSTIAETALIPISSALNYILADDIHSPLDVPPFDNSAMDGYAILASDLNALPVQLACIGESFAGVPFKGQLVPGSCVRIMTGAPMPAGSDAVVMQEHVTIDKQTVTFDRPVKTAQNIRMRGEDITKNQCILSKGQRINPTNLPLLASLGISHCSVFRKLKVAILSTGDELRSVGKPLSEGQIYDSNRYAITAVLNRLNAEIIDLGIIADNKTAISVAFEQADAEADVVICSGGVSVGEADFTKVVLEDMGQIGFWKLAIKPGKPFAFGQLPNSTFIGLPGNPVSAMVTLVILALPVIRQMSGETASATLVLDAISTAGIKKSPGRTDFQRGIMTRANNGQLQVATTGSQGSGVFTSFSKANCFIVLESERGRIEIGETVQVIPFDSVLN